MQETDTSLWENLLSLATILILLIFVGWLSGRILGVKRGFFRAALAGIVGFVAGIVLITIQFSDRDINDLGDIWTLGIGFLGYVLVVTLLASVTIDVILRPRSNRRGLHIPHPFRWIRERVSVLKRILHIVSAARRNGLVGPRLASPAGLASVDGARALRLTLEESGGILVKFGQIASTREDLLPPVITDELALLRSSVPGMPTEEVHAVIEAELGAPVSELFAEFTDTPLAAASIGVTHQATLRDGRSVIVKVQRPGISDSVRRDGQVLIWAAGQLQRRSESAARIGISGLAKELVAGITEELDFTRELANNVSMRRARKSDVGVAFPEIIAEMTTPRVLVMDMVEGEPVSDHAAIAATGVSPDVLTGHLLDSFLGQVLNDGVYHADPHPGNVLVDSAGVLWFIDYGAVGYLDPITLEALQQMAIGFTMRDPSVLARAVRRLARGQGDDIDISALEFDLGVLLTDFQGGGFDPSSLTGVLHVLSRHGVSAPQTLTVLARAMITIDGTLRTIDHDFRMGPAAAERMGDLVIARGLDPRHELTSEVLRALPVLRSIPQLGEDLALQARSGRLTIRVDRFSGADGVRVEQWLSRILFTAIGVVGLLGSALLLIAAGLVPNEPVANYLRIIGFVGIVLSTAMQLRVVARIVANRDINSE
jgi:ubiquinone biosynthesis protein